MIRTCAPESSGSPGAGTPRARSATVFCRALCLLFLCGLLAACEAAVYSGLTEHEANEMVMVLGGSGIRAVKKAGAKSTWDVLVDENMMARSLEVLAANGLPRAVYRNMGDVFRKDGMVSTPTEERARLVFAISQELAGTIAQIDGVLSARVHIVLPEMDSFGKKISSAKASVFIKHRADTDVASQIGSVRRLVENSVRDLKQDSVSVFLFPSTLQQPVRLPPQDFVLGVGVSPANAGLIRLGVFAALALALAGAALLALRWRKIRAAGGEA